MVYLKAVLLLTCLWPAAGHWTPILNPHLTPPPLEPQKQYIYQAQETQMERMLRSIQLKMDKMLDDLIRTKFEKELVKAVKKIKLVEGSRTPLPASGGGGSASISTAPAPLDKETGYHLTATRDIAPDTSANVAPDYQSNGQKRAAEQEVRRDQGHRRNNHRDMDSQTEEKIIRNTAPDTSLNIAPDYQSSGQKRGTEQEVRRDQDQRRNNHRDVDIQTDDRIMRDITQDTNLNIAPDYQSNVQEDTTRREQEVRRDQGHRRNNHRNADSDRMTHEQNRSKITKINENNTTVNINQNSNTIQGQQSIMKKKNAINVIPKIEAQKSKYYFYEPEPPKKHTQPVIERRRTIPINEELQENQINISQFALTPNKPQKDFGEVDLSTKIFVAGESPNITAEESAKSKRTAYYYQKPSPVFKVPNLGYNSIEHAPPDPFVALFLSHYGRYLPKTQLYSGYRNIYSYAAANNFHNNMPFGSYKIYEDASL